jgi:ribosomal protein L12E/L44/L45/RPP1/RPP2
MTTSFATLGPEHRAVLIAMLDVPAGFVDDRELAATVRRHHPGGLTAPPAELIDRLTDHFLRVTPLGIGWVHPSWRDLVIDRLRDDADARRRFLAACGVHGAMLALSRAGGPTGRRALPLLLTDADWDVLTDRVRDLVRELDDHDLARLLSAIGEATLDPGSSARAAEAANLAEYALSSARRAWDTARRAVPTGLLEAWYAVNALLPMPVTTPLLGPTWAELHPAAIPASARAELVAADEWLRLAQLLDRRDPAALAALGFPDRDGPTLGRLIAAARDAAERPDDELCALAEAVLARIRSLAPTHATATARARATLAVETAVRRDRWWTPADLDAPPTDEPASRLERFGADDVARVLRDL